MLPSGNSPVTIVQNSLPCAAGHTMLDENLGAGATGRLLSAHATQEGDFQGSFP